MTAGGGASVRARALGIEAEEIDGNDVMLVEETAARLIRAIRAGEGPRLLHAHTWRVSGHTGADPAAFGDIGDGCDIFNVENGRITPRGKP